MVAVRGEMQQKIQPKEESTRVVFAESLAVWFCCFNVLFGLDVDSKRGCANNVLFMGGFSNVWLSLEVQISAVII